MNPVVETPRILMRFVQLEDEEFLYELNSDPEVMTWLTDGKPNTRQDVQENMVRILNRRKFYNDKYGDLIGFYKETNEPFAWFCMRPPHDDVENFDLIEIGWRLKKNFWKKGLATEGARALLEKALNEYQAPKVFAKTMAGNIASENVMKKIGMEHKRNYREDLFPGENKDGVWYEISR